MSGLRHAKNLAISIRLSSIQWERVVQAAKLETERRGERVYPTRLLAEVGMAGVDRILRREAA